VAEATSAAGATGIFDHDLVARGAVSEDDLKSWPRPGMQGRGPGTLPVDESRGWLRAPSAHRYIARGPSRVSSVHAAAADVGGDRDVGRGGRSTCRLHAARVRRRIMTARRPRSHPRLSSTGSVPGPRPLHTQGVARIEIVFRYRTARYEIVVENPRGTGRGVASPRSTGRIFRIARREFRWRMTAGPTRCA